MPDYHIPVLLHESVNGLNIKPDGIYVDLTFGAGSHSKAILEQLGDKGRLIVFDQDEDALANVFEDSRMTFVDSNFRHLRRYLDYLEIDKVDGILGDLGVSSHQLDQEERGFSYRFNKVLDMRMNMAMPLNANQILNQYNFENLVDVFSTYGEVRNSKTLARKIIEQRNNAMPWTAERFNALLRQNKVGTESKYFAQVYQALRIEVNEELEVLKEILLTGREVLKEEGRFVIISYHSLEDRLVKRFFKTGNLNGKLDKDDFGRSLCPFKLINRQIITASADEITANSRSKSGKLRIAELIRS